MSQSYGEFTTFSEGFHESKLRGVCHDRMFNGLQNKKERGFWVYYILAFLFIYLLYHGLMDWATCGVCRVSLVWGPPIMGRFRMKRLEYDLSVYRISILLDLPAAWSMPLNLNRFLMPFVFVF